ncbi:TonB-dependent receptor [Algimonas arctica]|nr:TonB-dependent receptor [Algimonas arctica]
MQHISRIASALLASSMLVSPAFAQDNGDGDRFVEDVIIVQATRRASDVQDVPIAVTVINPVQLERQGVTNIQDLASVASGFNIQSSQTETQGTSIRIRGVGTTGNNIGLESAVGVFIDGVYQSRPGIALGEMVDIEAIEMLRGPQGTLFGRNVTAGALNIRTKAPELGEFGGFADFTYGNYNMASVQAGINLPAGDNLAFRATGSFRQRDGFLTSSVVPGAESHNRDRFILRGQALWEPTDATSFRLIADYQDVDENCCAAVTLSTSPNLSDATRDRLFPQVGFEDSLEAQVFNSQEFVNQVESFNVSGELNHDFGGATATVILSYSDFLGNSVQDDFNGSLQYTVAGETVPAANRGSFDDIKTFTAEARLQGEAFDGRLDWLIGGFYAQEDIIEEFTLGLGADYSTSVGEANFPIGPVAPAFLSLYAGAGAFIQQLQAGVANPVFAPLSADGQFAQNRFEQDASSFSVFTHNIFSVTDTVDLTLGLRYVDDTKDGSYDQIAAGGNSCLAAATFLATASAAGAGSPAAQGAMGALTAAVGPATVGLLTNPALIGGGGFLNCFPFASPAIGSGFVPDAFSAFGFLPEEYDDTFKDDELVYTARLAWEPTADLMIFGAYSHGYKAGGFNLDASAGAGGADPRFASETIEAYELGFKKTLADGRLRFNMTAFLQNMDDFQVLEFTGTAFQTFNVQDVSSKGFEAELNGRLSDTFFVNAGLTFADASYGDDCDDGGTIPEALGLCGSSLTNAPKISTVLGMTYDGKIGDAWGFMANVNLATQSKRRTSTRGQTAANGVITGDVPFDDQNATTKINARMGFTMPNEQVSIEFWGLNITDEITRGITFNTAVQGASRSAFIEAPRQYGVTLRTKF